MDKEIENNEDINTSNSQKEGNEMPALVKKEQSAKGLSLPIKKLSEITVKPKVKDGKLLLDNNNKDHRYIMEEDKHIHKQ